MSSKMTSRTKSNMIWITVKGRHIQIDPNSKNPLDFGPKISTKIDIPSVGGGTEFRGGTIQEVDSEYATFVASVKKKLPTGETLSGVFKGLREAKSRHLASLTGVSKEDFSEWQNSVDAWTEWSGSQEFPDAPKPWKKMRAFQQVSFVNAALSGKHGFKLDKNGKVELYRGVGPSEGASAFKEYDSKITEALSYDRPIRIEEELSSWTIHKKIAKNFSHDGGYVFKLKVPISSVWLWFGGTSSLDYTEGEVVIDATRLHVRPKDIEAEPKADEKT